MTAGPRIAAQLAAEMDPVLAPLKVRVLAVLGMFLQGNRQHVFDFANLQCTIV